MTYLQPSCLQSCRLLPACSAGGNSFNQLAVLATYHEAELPAVAHYFRSLACARPFTVARENLLLLFEHNRERCGFGIWLETVTKPLYYVMHNMTILSLCWFHHQ